MNTRSLIYFAIILVLVVATGGIILYRLLPDVPQYVSNEDPLEWHAPEINLLPQTNEAAIIRYGKELIVNTAEYLGPKGKIAALTNGMNCGNCHLDGGTRFNGNSFAAVASTYPKFRERSGKIETIEFRVNECMERSLNGTSLDSNSREMKAMVAYLKWLGKDVPKGVKPRGAGTPSLEVLDRAASVSNGQTIYQAICQSCHGPDGRGVAKKDSGFVYPPLWGDKSYNVSAGIYRLSRFAGFVKYNMPYTPTHTAPQLSDEDAWDVAAFVNSRQRPQKFFKYDWPNIHTKPFDYPFGPFADSFTISQHKYGPFGIIRQNKNAGRKS